MSLRIGYTLKTIALVMATLAACLWLAWMVGDFMLSRNVLPSDWLANQRWPLFIWRMVLIAALIAAWPHLCRWWVKERPLSDERWQQLLAFRWRLAGLLLLTELFIVQGFPLKFIG